MFRGGSRLLDGFRARDAGRLSTSRLGLAARRGGGGFNPQVILNDTSGTYAPFPGVTVVTTASALDTQLSGGARKIGVAAGATFTEAFDLSAYDNVDMRGVGDLATNGLPVFDGADEITGTWDTSVGRSDANTNVYTMAMTAGGWDSAQANYPLAYENGARLKAVTSLALCQAEAGTAFYEITSPVNGAGVPAGTSTYTLHIHPTGSTNPNSDGKTYEAIDRTWGVRLGDNCTAKFLHTKRAGENSGGLALGFGSLVENCLADDCLRHSAFINSGTVRNSVFWAQRDDVRTGMSPFVAYHNNTGFPSETVLVENSICVVENVDDADTPLGFYAHTGGAVDFTSIIYRDCATLNCGTAVTDVITHRVERLNTKNGEIELAGTNPVVLDANMVFDKALMPGNGGIQIGAGITGEVNIEGLRVFVNAANALPGSANALIRRVTGGVSSKINVRRSVIHATSAVDSGGQIAPLRIEADGDWDIDGVIFDNSDAISRGRFIVENGANTWEITGQNNVYSPGTQLVRFNNANTVDPAEVDVGDTTATNYITYQQANGTEGNSVTTDPALEDPANGDFRPTVTVPANSGLEREFITYTPVLSTLGDAINYVVNSLPLGDEHNRDPEFDTPANWTAPGGWSVSGGVATATDSSGANLRDGGVTLTATRYFYEIEVIDNTTSGLQLFNNADTEIWTLPAGGGILRGFIDVATGGGQMGLRPMGNGTVTVTRFSLREAPSPAPF